MKFKADEISSVLKAEIENFAGSVETADVGTVLEIGDGIARCRGLGGAMAGEMVEFENGTNGLVFNLEESSVGIIILGDYLSIREGETVKATGKLLSVPTGDALLG
ncbi:MAG: F0F1 ATP synthase subunit alpha, partial [Planctomycetota bacterium]